MRRILRSVVVALVMAAMILAIAMPALAQPPSGAGPPTNPGVVSPPAANELTVFIVCEEGGTIVFIAGATDAVGGGPAFVNINAVAEGFHTGSGSGCERSVTHER